MKIYFLVHIDVKVTGCYPTSGSTPMRASLGWVTGLGRRLDGAAEGSRYAPEATWSREVQQPSPTVPERPETHRFWLKAGVFLQPLVLDSASQAATDQRLSRVDLPRGLRRPPVPSVSERLARATRRAFMDPSFVERRGNGNHPRYRPPAVGVANFPHVARHTFTRRYEQREAALAIFSDREHGNLAVESSGTLKGLRQFNRHRLRPSSVQQRFIARLCSESQYSSRGAQRPACLCRREIRP